MRLLPLNDIERLDRIQVKLVHVMPPILLSCNISNNSSGIFYGGECLVRLEDRQLHN